MVINSGTIEGGLGSNGVTRANAVQFSGGANTLEIRSGSIITGNAVSSSGNTNGGDTLALGGAVDSSFDVSTIDNSGQYQGFANFGKTGTGTWTLTGTTSAAGAWNIQAGTLALGDSAALAGAVTVASGATLSAGAASIGALNNQGGVLVAAGKTLAVNGSFANTGKLRVGVDSNTGFGAISATGAAALGGALAVEVGGTPAFTSGLTLTPVIQAASVSGTFSQVTDNSLLFDFTPVYSATDVGLKIAAASTTGTPGTPDIPAAPGTPEEPAAPNSVQRIVSDSGNDVALPAARALDRVFAENPEGPLAALFVPMTSAQQVNTAVTQSLPLLSGGSQVAANAAQSGINHVVQARIENNRGLSSGDGFLGDNKLWLKPFGSWADQDDRNGVSGYDASVGGLALGMDGNLSARTSLGLSFAYARADVDSNSDVAPNSVDVDVYQLLGYGSYDLGNATAIDFQLGAGVNKNDGERDMSSFGLRAHADYDSTTAVAGTGIGHTFTLNESVKFTPSVRADYSWIKDRSYTESGADVLNLKVDSRSTDALVLGFDGKLAYAFDANTDLSVNLGAGYDAINDEVSIASAYAGAPGAAFMTEGLDVEPWLVRGGVGLTHTVNGTEIALRYDAEKRTDYLNQTASLKVRWAF